MALECEVVFENENWVVVDKPHAWLTVPARVSSDPRPCLGRHLQTELGLQIFPVHRLDFEVSGVIVFAKNTQAHKLSQSWFESGVVRKFYEALSRPGKADWDADEVEWHSRLIKGKKRAFAADYGKEATTRARVVERGEKFWRWNLEPVTGRSHQLRFEMARHEVPIFGDVLYGGEFWSEGKIALRAVRLDLTQIAERLGLPESLGVPSLKGP